MVKLKMGLPDKSLDKHPIGMAQMGGTKRAGDVHKQMVDGFDDSHKKIVEDVDKEVERMMKY
jgi:hypothetical protein